MSKFEEMIDSNPLLQGLPMDISWQEWKQRLSVNPFEGEDVQTLSPHVRELLLDQYENLYVPTATTVQIAMDIHRMLISGLIERHPYIPSQKRHVYDMLRASEGEEFKFPVSSARPRGMLLKGVTKLGKSRLAERVLSQYPQVIVRRRDERAAWIELRQLMYLVVPMPSDASKAGFLMNAFIELDNALGTSYAQEAKIRNATIDIQLVKLLALLVKHRCGLFIIEEGQEDHELSNVKFGRSFLTFFLRLLNTGIPTVLIGNPKAFNEISTSSQLMSRLSNPGARELTPCAIATNSEWTGDYVPGIWGANLLPEPDEPITDLYKFLWDRTGGFVHYLSMWRREATRIALVSGDRSLKRQHLDLAMKSTVMQVGAQIVTSYWNGRLGNDTDFRDIPGKLNPKIDKNSGRRRKPGGEPA